MRSHLMALAALLLAAPAFAEPAKPTLVRIGAVASGPSTVTVWRDVKRYLAGKDFPIDYVLYSNYDALVRALKEGHVDVAWNTPLAHARYHVQCGGKSQTLAVFESTPARPAPTSAATTASTSISASAVTDVHVQPRPSKR